MTLKQDVVNAATLRVNGDTSAEAVNVVAVYWEAAHLRRIDELVAALLLRHSAHSVVWCSLRTQGTVARTLCILGVVVVRHFAVLASASARLALRSSAKRHPSGTVA